MVDGQYFAMCIDVREALSYVEMRPYVFPLKTETLSRLLDDEFGTIQILRCACVAT